MTPFSSAELIERLSISPSDLELITLVVDVLLEEGNDDLGYCYKWCLKYNKYPKLSMNDRQEPFWYWYMSMGSRYIPVHCQLPSPIMSLWEHVNTGIICYDTYKQSMEALKKVLVGLKQLVQV